MKSEIQINNEKRIVFCELEGDPDVEEAILLALSLREKASALGFNVLYDVRKLCIPTSVMTAYDFSTKLSARIDSTLRKVKVAFLYDSGKFDDSWKFWETVSMNRGLQFRGFTDETEAMKWLSS